MDEMRSKPDGIAWVKGNLQATDRVLENDEKIISVGVVTERGSATIELGFGEDVYSIWYSMLERQQVLSTTNSSSSSNLLGVILSELDFEGDVHDDIVIDPPNETRLHCQSVEMEISLKGEQHLLVCTPEDDANSLAADFVRKNSPKEQWHDKVAATLMGHQLDICKEEIEHQKQLVQRFKENESKYKNRIEGALNSEKKMKKQVATMKRRLIDIIFTEQRAAAAEKHAATLTRQIEKIETLVDQIQKSLTHANDELRDRDEYIKTLITELEKETNEADSFKAMSDAQNAALQNEISRLKAAAVTATASAKTASAMAAKTFQSFPSQQQPQVLDFNVRVGDVLDGMEDGKTFASEKEQIKYLRQEKARLVKQLAVTQDNLRSAVHELTISGRGGPQQLPSGKWRKGEASDLISEDNLSLMHLKEKVGKLEDKCKDLRSKLVSREETFNELLLNHNDLSRQLGMKTEALTKCQMELRHFEEALSASEEQLHAKHQVEETAERFATENRVLKSQMTKMRAEVLMLQNELEDVKVSAIDTVEVLRRIAPNSFAQLNMETKISPHSSSSTTTISPVSSIRLRSASGSSSSQSRDSSHSIKVFSMGAQQIQEQIPTSNTRSPFVESHHHHYEGEQEDDDMESICDVDLGSSETKNENGWIIPSMVNAAQPIGGSSSSFLGVGASGGVRDPARRLEANLIRTPFANNEEDDEDVDSKILLQELRSTDTTYRDAHIAGNDSRGALYQQDNSRPESFTLAITPVVEDRLLRSIYGRYVADSTGLMNLSRFSRFAKEFEIIGQHESGKLVFGEIDIIFANALKVIPDGEDALPVPPRAFGVRAGASETASRFLPPPSAVSRNKITTAAAAAGGMGSAHVLTPGQFILAVKEIACRLYAQLIEHQIGAALECLPPKQKQAAMKAALEVMLRKKILPVAERLSLTPWPLIFLDLTLTTIHTSKYAEAQLASQAQLLSTWFNHYGSTASSSSSSSSSSSFSNKNDTKKNPNDSTVTFFASSPSLKMSNLSHASSSQQGPKTHISSNNVAFSDGGVDASSTTMTYKALSRFAHDFGIVPHLMKEPQLYSIFREIMLWYKSDPKFLQSALPKTILELPSMVRDFALQEATQPFLGIDKTRNSERLVVGSFSLIIATIAMNTFPDLAPDLRIERMFDWLAQSGGSYVLSRDMISKALKSASKPNTLGGVVSDEHNN